MHLPGMAWTIRLFRTARLFATARHGRPVLPNVGRRLQPKGRAEALRASLVSATSLLALLLLGGSEAGADPIISVGTSVPFFTVLGNQFDAGTEAAGRSSATQSYMFTPLTSGAAATVRPYADPTPVRSLPSPPVVDTPFGRQSSALPGVASGRGSAAFGPAGPVTVPKTGAGGGQFLPGLVPGASVFDAAAADQAVGSAATKTPRSAIREEVEKAFYLGVPPDPDGGNHADVNPYGATVMGLRMVSPDPSTFTVSSIPGGTAVPVPVVGTGAGELSSSLTIFTAAAARLSDGDGRFAFFFDPGDPAVTDAACLFPPE
jgi:hypothetical protein